MLRSELEYARVPSPENVEQFISYCRQSAVHASDEINRAFFRQHGTVVWSH
jgi:hypothetical protein